MMSKSTMIGSMQELLNREKHPFKDMLVPPDFDLKQYVLRADLQEDSMNNYEPSDGYECFVPNPHDESVLAKLGLA
jgi:hypothetical protein